MANNKIASKGKKGGKICIICKKELTPAEIKGAKRVVDDVVIKTIRKIKNFLNVASNNELYVCKEHLEEHNKKRKNYEKSIVLTLVFALVIFLGLTLLPVFNTGEININSMLLGLIVAVLLTLLNGLIKYTPTREV